MILTRAFHCLSDSLLGIAYPQPCALCGQSVEQGEFGIACAGCWRQSRQFDGSETICWKCGLASPGSSTPSNRSVILCHRCDELKFTTARACGVYEGALREAVLRLKREPRLSRHVLNMLVEAARRSPLDVCTRVVPVPIHEQRRKTRGFNQASVIATGVAQVIGLPLDEVSLVRTGLSDKHRAGLDAKGRQDTVAGAFEVRHPGLVKAEEILLVDDVFTTGATASSCAEVLLAAGACGVHVLTIARPDH